VKQLDKIIQPNFQALDYNYQNFELKRAYEVAVIFRQGHCSQNNGENSEKSELCLVIQ
jgi:hypothetical protein